MEERGRGRIIDITMVPLYQNQQAVSGCVSTTIFSLTPCPLSYLLLVLLHIHS
jgi:hypothetical protein